jgi:RimJ/RimL family protein N-acetyltransferase
MEPEVLTTARVRLVPTGPQVFDDLWAAIEASRPELSPWMPWAVDPTPAAVREFTERAAERWSTGSDRPFTLVVEGRACGQCSLDRVDTLAHQCEIGYWLRSDLAGRGLMTEAAAAVVEFGFAECALHRIELHAGIENAASIRVAEKLGFQREGLLRGRGLGAAGYYDMYVYGLLEGDDRPVTRRSDAGW